MAGHGAHHRHAISAHHHAHHAQHQHRPGTNFAGTHVKSSPADYLYPMRLPGKLIQIKLVVDLPRVNRHKETFSRRKVRLNKPSNAGSLHVRTSPDDYGRITSPPSTPCSGAAGGGV